MSSIILVVALSTPLIGGLLASRERSALRAGRVAVVGCAVAVASAAWLLVATAIDGDEPVAVVSALDLRVDRVSSMLLLVVLATAAMVASFSRRSLDADGRAGRYFALLGVVVSGSALVVVPGAGWLLVVGWLASGWALAGLTGFAAPWRRADRARRRILATLAIGDVALVVAVVVAVSATDSFFAGGLATAIADLEASTVLGFDALGVVCVLLVIAGAARSALFPFHRWLVGTLVAPTPVSALVHAGFVSGAGLLLIRFAPVFVRSDAAVILAFAVGLITVVFASSVSMTRSDAKGALAWSTVSQMAFMVVQCAVGAFSSAVFHIAGHGMYKAALFLGAGDTAATKMRTQRDRPMRTMGAATVWAVAVVVPTIAVAVLMWTITPEVSDAGQVLVAVFAWATSVFGLRGWLARGAMAPGPTIAVGGVATAAAVAAYVGGLRLVEAFLKPALPTGTDGTIVGPTTVLVAIAVVTVAVGALFVLPEPARGRARAVWRRWVDRWAIQGAPTVATAGSDAPLEVAESTETARAEVRGEVAEAAAIIAPLWPLSSFVAVNPLGGLESMGFDAATASAHRWLRGRTHLPLEEYRSDHRSGLTTAHDLREVVERRFGAACASKPVRVGARTVDPVEVIVADLLHGPERDSRDLPRTALERLGESAAVVVEAIDDAVADWLAEFVSPPAWPEHRPGESFVAVGRRRAACDPRSGGLIGRSAQRWLDELERLADDPAAVILAAFAVTGVGPEHRVDEMRGHVARLSGWSGLAKWRREWAAADERSPEISIIEIIAVHAMVEAAVVSTLAGGRLTTGHVTAIARVASADDEGDDVALLADRVDAVAAALVGGDAADDDRAAVLTVLERVPAHERVTVWLEAQEHQVDRALLADLDGAGRTIAARRPADRPDAQVVFCIDVRSEGLRRHLEAHGNVETLGFAGFFGVPMRVQRLGWQRPEARCPVLVNPAIEVAEFPRNESLGEVAAVLARRRSAVGVDAAHRAAKHGPGGPFVLAETAGWALGPAAMTRTWWPGTARPADVPATTMRFDDDEALIEQRTFFAEAVLNTMGLIDGFAPLVVLCGHTSVTVNNPHATALECGACAGASGDSNARAVASLLNDPEIRHQLVHRGITIPDDTWFVAGLHDTASDHVTLLDVADVPGELTPIVDDLRTQLAEAGHRQATARAPHLPGDASAVRDRGADWAQVRPEWGLARNSAFIIGPRAMTEQVDLDGRAFLHTYDADLDPSGRVLETIMTAPLVVGHWISSQYYFSTVDPEVFGAGDKLLHNPVGATGVISGDAGDLRVGLPLQSTHVDGRRHHQPVRLLAVIEADLERIEGIIASHPILTTLTSGSWLRVAARSGPGSSWSVRHPDGTWQTVASSSDDRSGLVDHLTRENT